MKRKQKGQEIIELLIGLLVLIPIALVLTDGIVLLSAKQLVDRAARDACRAASTGNPTPATATSRATQVLKTYKPGGYLSGLALVGSPVFNPATPVPNPGGHFYNGTVALQVQVTATLPASIPPLPKTQDIKSQPIAMPITYCSP